MSTLNISPQRRPIQQLDDAAANRIAAGEVVERPASAVKELVENAIDAGATRVDISIANGGKSLIEVDDDGFGIPRRELALALTRHATSKIDGHDLVNIAYFGFRGEALPSLGAVGRLEIESREVGGTEAWAITAEAGRLAAPRPSARARGTKVALRDIFFATPARLKFMRSDQAEARAVSDTVKRLALATPEVGFTLTDRTQAPRKLLDLPATGGLDSGAAAARMAQILGREFLENSFEIDAERDGLTLTGRTSLPTFSKGAAVAQFLFVNNRPVRDKMLNGALRAAYRDVMSHDRHPVAALYLTCPPPLVDVNVHPAKSEVRFRDAGVVRGLLISAIRHGLAEHGHRASSTVAEGVLGAFQPERPPTPIYQMDMASRSHHASTPGFAETAAPSARYEAPAPGAQTPDGPLHDDALDAGPLGAARAQIHENYIVAQTPNGMVIVDQHAAHERLVYEQLKTQMAARDVPSQALLIPEIVELTDAALVLDIAPELSRMGLEIEPFGSGAVAIRAVPAVLGQADPAQILRDIADELADQGKSTTLEMRINAILSRMSCHGSIRSGRIMSAAEMNALLRQMEAEPLSGQCNHGRPTYVTLALDDIEKLFGRK